MWLLERDRAAGTGTDRTKQRVSVEARSTPRRPVSRETNLQGLQGTRNTFVDTGDAAYPVRRLGYTTGQMTWVLRQINDQEKKKRLGELPDKESYSSQMPRVGLVCEQTLVTYTHRR